MYPLTSTILRDLLRKSATDGRPAGANEGWCPPSVEYSAGVMPGKIGVETITIRAKSVLLRGLDISSTHLNLPLWHYKEYVIIAVTNLKVVILRTMREIRLKASSDRTQGARCMCVDGDAATLHREYTLSDIRRRVGLTQCQMAEKLNVSQPAYASFEKSGNLRVGTLQKIASALGGELLLSIKLHNADMKVNLDSTWNS